MIRPHKKGESWRQMIVRVKQFLDELDGEGDVLVISHGGVIRILLHIMLNRDLEDMVHNNKPKNTALYILEKKGESYIPILENCDEHIGEIE